jgi:mannosyltransferase OCH1-like enzyme
MPAVRMNSPSAPYFRNKISTQWRRVLPVYSVLLILVIIFGNAHFFNSPMRAASKVKRELKYHQSKKFQIHTPHFPRKIWQTWKTGPLMFEERDWTTARSWPEKNPSLRYEVLTDDNEMGYLESQYGPHALNRPDLIDLYRSITAHIIKADLLRYLIMYAEGGIYADIDVESLRPFDTWIPDRFNEQDIDMVIGVEIDQPKFANHSILGPKSRSFCQWTFVCKPHLPVMMRLIENVQRWITSLARERGVSVSELELDFDDVISGTGPSAFTTAVLEQMNLQRAGNSKHEIAWDDFHQLRESKLISRFLVLNVEAFCAGQGHSDSGTHSSRGALVKHHYHASGWDAKHTRKIHPMYGPVEACNWDPWCVAKWDHDMAEWDKLAPEEQKRRIEEEQQRKLAEAVPPPMMGELNLGLPPPPLAPLAPLAQLPPPPLPVVPLQFPPLGEPQVAQLQLDLPPPSL